MRKLKVFSVILGIMLSLCVLVVEKKTIKVNNEMHSEEFDDNDSIEKLCQFFYSTDSLNDTVHFDFDRMEDFGPVSLSNSEIKQIYHEIKRGNLEAYKLLLIHYFYTYPYNLPANEIEKLICITDYLTNKYKHYYCYYFSANTICSYLDYYKEDKKFVEKMLEYYEKYYEYSKSRMVAKKLKEIYSGDYWFCERNSEKEEYYSQKCESE